MKENKGFGLYLLNSYENRIWDNSFIGNKDFSILDSLELSQFRMNKYGYNYCESEFYFIVFVIIGVISIISVYKFLMFYRKANFIKKWVNLHGNRISRLLVFDE